jgi:transcriptional regulator GlxA family with amidase domain
LSWEWVITQGPKVNWKKKARFVDNLDVTKKSGFITSSGVSAGIDMTLHLISKIYGEEIAEYACKRMEYIWNRDADNDPFCT